MDNLLIKLYFNSKIQYNGLYNYLDSSDYYINIPIKDCLKKYSDNLKSFDSSNSSKTLNYVYLLYNNICNKVYYCINTQLKAILFKFAKLNEVLKNSMDNLELISLLPKEIINYFALELSKTDINMDVIHKEISILQESLSPVFAIYDCDLERLIMVCDLLNGIIDMLYDPNKWYKENKEYLNSDDGNIAREAFNKYFPGFVEK